MSERKDLVRIIGGIAAAFVASFHPVEARAQSLEYILPCPDGSPIIFIYSIEEPKDMRLAVLVRGISVDLRVGYAYSYRDKLGRDIAFPWAPLISGERYRVELAPILSFDSVTERITISADRVYSKEFKAPYCATSGNSK